MEATPYDPVESDIRLLKIDPAANKVERIYLFEDLPQK